MRQPVTENFIKNVLETIERNLYNANKYGVNFYEVYNNIFSDIKQSYDQLYKINLSHSSKILKITNLQTNWTLNIHLPLTKERTVSIDPEILLINNHKIATYNWDTKKQLLTKK